MLWCLGFVGDQNHFPKMFRPKFPNDLSLGKNVLRNSKHNIISWAHSDFRVEGPITETARRCFSAEWARGTKSCMRMHEPKSERIEGRIKTLPILTNCAPPKKVMRTSMCIFLQIHPLVQQS